MLILQEVGLVLISQEVDLVVILQEVDSVGVPQAWKETFDLSSSMLARMP